MFKLINSKYGELGTIFSSLGEFRSLVKKKGLEMPFLYWHNIKNVTGSFVSTAMTSEEGGILEEFHYAPYGCSYAVVGCYGVIQRSSFSNIKTVYKRLCNKYGRLLIREWDEYAKEYVFTDESEELEEEALY